MSVRHVSIFLNNSINAKVAQICLTYLKSYSRDKADGFYSFKCGTNVFMCGGLTESQICSNSGADKNGAYIAASVADCDGMIAATMPTTGSTFSYKCPIVGDKSNAISHYVKYGCNGGKGTKFELEKSVVVTSQCSCDSEEGCGKNTKCNKDSEGGKFE
jgi:hypothetical protein